MKLTRLIVLLVTLAAVVVLPAAADTIYDLNVGSAGLGGSPPWGSVKVELIDSTHAKITFTATPTGVIFDSQAFDFNTLGTVTGGSLILAGGYSACVKATSPCISNQTSNAEVSEFGRFNYTFDMFDGTKSGVPSAWFTLTLGSGTWSSSDDVLLARAASDGHHAAAHICASDGQGGCLGSLTGYAADGTAVPEPASMLLLAAGGLGLLGFSRFRK